ncbi:hypothetical protein MC5_03115 [Rickettsia australis str. Cutlack]|uniref:Ankyrin repeat-containing protein n=1 Tax=Rickettsia australis (strain Cutlack) TaxID=1105110 RepID=H8K6T1_RICAC|nr:hypothetical protein MC5_03115 [Rickettsia australis str. Cutlack]
MSPREKGSWIKNRLGTSTIKTINTEIVITLEYLKQYFNEFHHLEGTALNIIASLDDPNLNKLNVIELQSENKFKSLEFALKNNNEQAEYLLNHLTFEPNSSLIQAIQNQNLTLVKYCVEKQKADVNFSNFGFHPLRLAACLAAPYKTDTTCYLLIKVVTYLNTTLEGATQGGQTVHDLHKQIFFKAINENKLEVIKKFVGIYVFDVNTEYCFKYTVKYHKFKK